MDYEITGSNGMSFVATHQALTYTFSIGRHYRWKAGAGEPDVHAIAHKKDCAASHPTAPEGTICTCGAIFTLWDNTYMNKMGYTITRIDARNLAIALRIFISDLKKIEMAMAQLTVDQQERLYDALDANEVAIPKDTGTTIFELSKQTNIHLKSVLQFSRLRSTCPMFLGAVIQRSEWRHIPAFEMFIELCKAGAIKITALGVESEQ